MNYSAKTPLHVFLIIFIVHCSAVFVSGYSVDECMQNIHKIFEENKSPKEHFLEALEKYNHDSFLNPEKNDSAHGYFKKLIKSIKEVEKAIIEAGDIILSPKMFCQQYDNEPDQAVCKDAMVGVVGDVDVDRKQEIDRIQEMSEIEALKYCYLTQTKIELAKINVVPQEYEARVKDVIDGYFDHLLNKANTIADFAEFNDPFTYCTFKLNTNDHDDDSDDDDSDDDDSDDDDSDDNDENDDGGNDDDNYRVLIFNCYA